MLGLRLTQVRMQQWARQKCDVIAAKKPVAAALEGRSHAEYHTPNHVHVEV